MLATTSSLVPGMAIVLGIDKFMSECRALTNLAGNGVGYVIEQIRLGRAVPFVVCLSFRATWRRPLTHRTSSTWSGANTLSWSPNA
jgi:hypothetical protein